MAEGAVTNSSAVVGQVAKVEAVQLSVLGQTAG